MNFTTIASLTSGTNYTLLALVYSGTAGNSLLGAYLKDHNPQQFSTIDQDNDGCLHPVLVHNEVAGGLNLVLLQTSMVSAVLVGQYVNAIYADGVVWSTATT